MNYKYIIIFLLLISIGSCTVSVNTGIVDLDPLKKYYETDKISLKEQNDTIEINIKNAQLLMSDIVEPKDLKPMELFASVGALLVSDQINNKHDGEFIKLTISKDRNFEFIYNIRELHFIKECVIHARGTIDKWYEGKHEFVINQFENEMINNQQKKQSAMSILTTLFTANRYKENSLIGYTIKNGVLLLFINVYFINGESQSYKVFYQLKGPIQISGITVPE